ncbi:MAG: ABC transporter permease [Gemmatimonadaceae bacterium]
MTANLPHKIRRLLTLRSRGALLRDDDDEMRIHIEMWVAEYESYGMARADAEAAALQRFGDSSEYRAYIGRRAERVSRWEAARDWFSEWMHDVRFAARHLRNTPAFSATAILTLALGIGASSAIFSVVHRLLIDPLPYPNGDRIVALKTNGSSGFVVGLATSPTNAPEDPSRALAHAWAARATHSFDAMAGVEPIFLSMLPDGRQDTVSHALVTSNLLSMLGAEPALGRGFRREEEIPGASRVAMISYAWWQRVYGGSTDALGKIAEYEENPYTIVGVMPKGFAIPMSQPRGFGELALSSPDVWLPDKLVNTQMMFGLLKRGVSAADATRELQAIADTPPASAGGGPGAGARPGSVHARAMRAQDFLAPREVRAIQVLFVAVGALLLIACANVANLLLVRAWTRRREFAVRMGLGAGRARLIRLALTESVLLALVSGTLGVAIAWQGLHVIIALRPAALERLSDVQIEPAVLFWTAAVSVVTGVLFGAAAAFFVSTQNTSDLLRSETGQHSSGAITRRVRSTLVVAEIALSVALLVATGLLVRSFAALSETRIGFDPHNLVAVDVLMGPQVRRSGQSAAIREAVVQALRETPGIVAAGVGSMPAAGLRETTKLEVMTDRGMELVGMKERQKMWISSDYFSAAGIPIVAGRAPKPAATDEPPVASGLPMGFDVLSAEVIVSRGLARRLAPDGNVVGLRIRVADTPDRFHPPNQPVSPTGDPWATIVGVAEDVHLPGPRGDLETYQLYQMPVTRMMDPMFVARFASVPRDVESVLRKTIQAVSPTLIVRRARIGDDYLREALAPTRFTLALLGAFAIVALVLSVVGLYGSIAYTVTQRTREIGIRIALGATPGGVTSLVVADGVRLLGLGLVVGIATAVLSTRALTSLLYGVSTVDPLTFVSIVAIVATIALAASILPARRAATINPVDALRAE